MPFHARNRRRRSRGTKPALCIATSLRLKLVPPAADHARVRSLLLALPRRHQHYKHWQYAVGLLLEAAIARGLMAGEEAQFLRALKADGLL
jgi:hypothetical protein